MRRKRWTVLAVFAMVVALLPLSAVPAAAAGASVFINEIHYDNASTDVGEAIEVAGPAGTDLSGWSIVLYNGNGGASYGTTALSGVLADAGSGYGFTVLTYPTNGIQNGSPDGVALVDSGDAVVQFLSYEGSFMAVGGPADGMTSTDIGVSEPNSTPVGDSLQLVGTGAGYGDFTWAASQPDTFGSVNAGQTFGVATGPTDPIVNEFVANHTGSDTQAFVEVFGDPSTDYSAFTVLEIEGDSSGAGTIDAVLPIGITNSSGYWTDPEDMENGTITILLVEGFTGSKDDDLDTNDDGVFDSTPWTRIVDSVGVNDGGSSDHNYSNVVLVKGYDSLNSYTVGGASRIPNGTDADTTADWMRNDFDGFGFPGFAGSPALGEAINTPGAVNEAITVLTDPLGVCGDSATFIHDIQGAGAASADVGSIREIEGVVVGDFDGPNQLNGFFVQEEDGQADGNPLTSEGIFVYSGGSPDVSVGDLVRVRGTVKEQFGLTELSPVASVTVCPGDTNAPTPATITFPLAAVSNLESFEGMSIIIPQQLYVSGNYTLGRYGELDLSIYGPLDNPTNVVAPGAAAIALQDLNDRSRIQLDDGSNAQNPVPPPPYFNADGTLRTGDTVVGSLTGVLGYAFGAYEVQPTGTVTFASDNSRPGVPDVGGSLHVAAFNVLNYFTTLDDGNPICGPDANQDCRGADNAFEFGRQKAKIVSAITKMDADVVGLMEIENYPGNVPVADLVGGLNDATEPGRYDYIATGAVGTDAIRQAIIFQPGAVTPLGEFAALDSSVDPMFNDAKNRPALAQTFMENATDEVFTVVVNHLKSKGSPCDSLGDPDVGDGQGNCNLTRKAAAQALVNWLATDPTGSEDSDFLITGDLNSYAMEDPITAIKAAGYTDLISQFEGSGWADGAYSFNFQSQSGYLDHALTTPSLSDQVTGAAFWHINADEPSALDYNDYNQAALYQSNEFRASDHDPVIVGLNLAPIELTATPDALWPVNHKYVGVTVSATIGGTPVPVVIDSVESSENDAGYNKGDKPVDVGAIDGDSVMLRAERFTPEGRVYTITVFYGGTWLGTVEVVVPHDLSKAPGKRK